MGTAKFKYTKFVVSIDKDIHNEFKNTHRTQEASRASLRGSNIFANIRIYALYYKDVALLNLHDI